MKKRWLLILLLSVNKVHADEFKDLSESTQQTLSQWQSDIVAWHDTGADVSLSELAHFTLSDDIDALMERIEEAFDGDELAAWFECASDDAVAWLEAFEAALDD
ncbi:hypothetical protein [Shewanella sp. NIFS-20-20]|uniref:hypothetical protein n=1 Tax=Shewanella sp. NIFS-20-20 TaxID=2853806 RepID=UPI001C4511BF|nr:hypothetical protein [Shewanella sp. NIFS-20-20]MBV7316504.1 hypothetical protein [Shewanella sp. NIFS-20-20]